MCVYVCVYMSACLFVGNRVSSDCLYSACMTHSPSVSLSVSLSLSLTDYVCLNVHVSQSVCMYVLCLRLAICRSIWFVCLYASLCLCPQNNYNTR